MNYAGYIPFSTLCRGVCSICLDSFPQRLKSTAHLSDESILRSPFPLQIAKESLFTVDYCRIFFCFYSSDSLISPIFVDREGYNKCAIYRKSDYEKTIC